MNIHQDNTIEMLSTFPDNFQLDNQTRALHLMEEAIELVGTISRKEKKIPGELQEGELEEAFGGVLFDLFVLASQNNIDLDKVYPEELKKFKKYSK